MPLTAQERADYQRLGYTASEIALLDSPASSISVSPPVELNRPWVNTIIGSVPSSGSRIIDTLASTPVSVGALAGLAAVGGAALLPAATVVSTPSVAAAVAPVASTSGAFTATAASLAARAGSAVLSSPALKTFAALSIVAPSLAQEVGWRNILAGAISPVGAVVGVGYNILSGNENIPFTNTTLTPSQGAAIAAGTAAVVGTAAVASAIAPYLNSSNNDNQAANLAPVTQTFPSDSGQIDTSQLPAAQTGIPILSSDVKSKSTTPRRQKQQPIKVNVRNNINLHNRNINKVNVFE